MSLVQKSNTAANEECYIVAVNAAGYGRNLVKIRRNFCPTKLPDVPEDIVVQSRPSEPKIPTVTTLLRIKPSPITESKMCLDITSSASCCIKQT